MIGKETEWSLLRISVVLALLAIFCILLFLWQGFRAWTVGIGVFLGFPLLLLAMLLYAIVVLRDLRRRGVL